MGFNNYSSNLEVSGEQAMVKRIIKLGMNEVFDVGANAGQYSKEFLRHSKARVFAFEPMLDSYNELKKISDTNSRLVPFNFAIGANNYIGNIFFGSATDQLATLSDAVLEIPYVGRNNSNSQKIEVRTLDSVLDELKKYYEIDKIDCIKVDTEGFEIDVLQGATMVLRQYEPKVIIMEWNWHQLFRDATIWSVHKYLPNYKVFRVLPFQRGFYKVDVRSPVENIAYYSNLVFIREDLETQFLDDL